MAAQVPLSPDSRRSDLDHLNLLAIFHFVGAGLGALGLLFLLGHYVILHTLLFAPGVWVTRHRPAPPPQARLILALFYGVLGSWFAASAAANLGSGFLLRARRGRTFSMIVAGCNCAHVPLGTILGVFTFTVLSRDSVKRLYLARAGAISPTGRRGAMDSGSPPPIAPPPPAAITGGGGDLTGGIIPYKNPRALAAYYLGVFGLIPGLGFIPAAFAVPFGIAGLRARARHPAVRGRIHAWIGIVLGSLAVGLQLLLAVVILLGTGRPGL